mgnify:CR=1 FL=1
MDLLSAFLGFYRGWDWRAALLATLFTLPWLALLAWRRLGQRWLWLAVVAGAALFGVSIGWVQTPIQLGLNALWLGSLGVPTAQRYALLLALPSLLAGSLVQEGTKLLVAAGSLRLARAERTGEAGLALGAAAGAGYGGFEAFWTMNTIFSVGLTWATVQLGGPLVLLGYLERFFAVPFHIGAVALSGYGYATGRTWRFLLLAVGLHTAVNYGALATRYGLVDPLAVEGIVALGATAAMTLALWVRRGR